jgi:septal ring factor EnvC (AmiA/AmiB activator)
VAEHAARVEEDLGRRGAQVIELRECLEEALRIEADLRDSRLSVAEHAARVEEDLGRRGAQVVTLEASLAETSDAATAATMRAQETGQQLASTTRELEELRSRHAESAEWAARLQEDMATRGERLAQTEKELEEERSRRDVLEYRIERELNPEIGDLKTALSRAESRLGELEHGEQLAADRGRHGRELIALRAELDSLVTVLRAQPEN